MARKSKYPNARDIREVLVPEVAQVTGIDSSVVGAAADAELFAIAAYSNSGGTVVWSSGRVSSPIVSGFGDWLLGEEGNELAILESLPDDQPLASVVAALPPEIPLPRYYPVFDIDLTDLAVDLAIVRDSTLDPDLVWSAAQQWCLISGEYAYRAAVGLEDISDVVIRRLWEASERDFEDWQVENLDWDSQLHTEVVQRQWHAPDGTIADVLCRVNESEIDDFRPGDLLVIENKAFEATPAAVDQLAGYVEHACEQFESDDTKVHGMLVALGIGDETEAAAERAGFTTLTWGEIGYLDHLWAPNSKTRPIQRLLNAAPEVES